MWPRIFGNPFRSLGNPGGGAGGYLLNILFSTDDAAPLTNPYVGEVGALVPVEVDGTLAVSSGVMTNTAQASPIEGDLGVYSSAKYNRVAGRAYYCKMTLNTLNTYPIIFCGVNLNANSTGAEMTARMENPLAVNDGGYLSLGRVLTATTYEIWLIPLAVGGYLIAKGGNFTNASIRWWFKTGSTAQLTAAIGYYNGLASVDRMTVLNLPAPFNASLASVNITPDGTARVISNHSQAEITFSLPGSPSAGQKIHLYYRMPTSGDAGVNGWDAYLERNAGNTAWNFKLDRITASVATNAISTTGVGNVTTIRVNFEGSNHDCWTLVGTVWTKRGTTIANATHNTGTYVNTAADAGFTQSNLTVHTLDLSAYESVLIPT